MASSPNIRAAMLLREYAQDDELRADDDIKYADGTHADGFRTRARLANEAADELDPEGANA